MYINFKNYTQEINFKKDMNVYTERELGPFLLLGTKDPQRAATFPRAHVSH